MVLRVWSAVSRSSTGAKLVRTDTSALDAASPVAKQCRTGSVLPQVPVAVCVDRVQLQLLTVDLEGQASSATGRVQPLS